MKIDLSLQPVLSILAVYFEQGEYDKAIAECHEAVEIGRENRADFQLIAKYDKLIALLFISFRSLL